MPIEHRLKCFMALRGLCVSAFAWAGPGRAEWNQTVHGLVPGWTGNYELQFPCDLDLLSKRARVTETH